MQATDILTLFDKKVFNLRSRKSENTGKNSRRRFETTILVLTFY